MNMNDETSASTGGAGSAEDFVREYEAKDNNSIRIQNASGDVIVRGVDGNRIRVRGIKEGRDRNQVEVKDDSNDDAVDLGVKYNCRNCNASIRFEVEVPRAMRLRYDEISTASGNVRVSDITGRLGARSASGNVKIENVMGNVEAESASGDVTVENITGEVSAETASGNVAVRIKQLTGEGDMRYYSASGNVEVAVPADINADVRLSTKSGNVKTDFPLEVKKREFGPGETAEGKLGSGGRQLRLSTASGNVKLVRL
jgi:DUF4097 and DUF4098 domain-containing protein YvlB